MKNPDNINNNPNEAIKGSDTPFQEKINNLMISAGTGDLGSFFELASTKKEILDTETKGGVDEKFKKVEKINSAFDKIAVSAIKLSGLISKTNDPDNRIKQLSTILLVNMKKLGGCSWEEVGITAEEGQNFEMKAILWTAVSELESVKDIDENIIQTYNIISFTLNKIRKGEMTFEELGLAEEKFKEALIKVGKGLLLKLRKEGQIDDYFNLDNVLNSGFVTLEDLGTTEEVYRELKDIARDNFLNEKFPKSKPKPSIVDRLTDGSI